MSELYWLMAEQMARLQPFFPRSHGRARDDVKIRSSKPGTKYLTIPKTEKARDGSI
jgi:hypothetical protein